MITFLLAMLLGLVVYPALLARAVTAQHTNAAVYGVASLVVLLVAFGLLVLAAKTRAAR
jgi:hypothetical protein